MTTLNTPVLNRLVKLNSGHYIPMVGIGTYNIFDQHDLMRVCDEALKAGYRLFDTAALFDNEIELGEALKKLLPKHNLTRKDIYIITKLWVDNVGDRFRTENAVKKSLEKLQTDYIDLYLIHWPGNRIYNWKDPRNSDVRRKTWSSLIHLHKKGILKSIGVSNYAFHHILDMMLDFDGVPPAVNQVEFHVHCYDDELLNECKINGIHLQAYSPLGGPEAETVLNDPLVCSVAKRLNVSSSRLLLRWCIQHDVSIIPKAAKKEHLYENTQLDFEIPEDMMEELDMMPILIRYGCDTEHIV